MSLANQTGVIGVTNDSAYTAPSTQSYGLFPLGTVVIMNGTDYVYAQAAAAQAAAATFGLTVGYATTTGTTYTHDVAAPGVAINQYFFAKKVASPF